ncbi:MAG: hypothetical protein Q9220_005548 [cf. Caloplaca sp. 1 TL-2023]
MSSYSPTPGFNEPFNASFIDTSNPEDVRTSFRTTTLDSIKPFINARFPNIEPHYLTKIFRGTIGTTGLIWLDIDRQDFSPLDFSDLAHLLYCFEVYAQIICIMARPQGMEHELELQHALADYRIRLLKMSKWATFESLLAWHKAYLDDRFRLGQDLPDGWRQKREDLATLLRKKMREPGMLDT